MISREQVTFSAQGDSFIPSQVSARYTSFHDPGKIGTLGRYKDLPIPYGSADFEAPENEKDKILFLHRLIAPILPDLKAAGATHFRLHITYNYEDQCAIGFSKEELRMIVELDCDLPIDCFTQKAEQGS